MLGLSCSTGVFDLCFGTQDLVPWPWIESKPHELEAQSLSDWTGREVSIMINTINNFYLEPWG